MFTFLSDMDGNPSRLNNGFPTPKLRGSFHSYIIIINLKHNSSPVVAHCLEYCTWGILEAQCRMSPRQGTYGSDQTRVVTPAPTLWARPSYICTGTLSTTKQNKRIIMGPFNQLFLRSLLFSINNSYCILHLQTPPINAQITFPTQLYVS